MSQSSIPTEQSGSGTAPASEVPFRDTHIARRRRLSDPPIAALLIGFARRRELAHIARAAASRTSALGPIQVVGTWSLSMGKRSQMRA